ncbi:MAG: NADH-quinone oxidoreductase subunit M [Bdellovibrio sp.]|nr:MAG: NADH-quinone oxidoreductase subunit M [Bdellovibrio sp.]
MFLSLLIFLPAFFALFLLLIKKEFLIRAVAFGSTVFVFILSLFLVKFVDPQIPHLQLVEKVKWIPSFGISYFVGIDGISLWLVLLTTFLTPLTILGSWSSVKEKVKMFHVLFLLLESAMLGSFLAFDAVLFYCFFEASLIPMYFLIGIWGGARRIYATLKFFIYTMFGSLFMLAGIIALMLMTKSVLNGEMSASLLDFYKLQIPFIGGNFLSPQNLLFFCFALAFAIKVPMFPVHTWLPDAHVEAPTPGSVILAGVMLKMGTYGFLRFALPLFPQATEYWTWLFMFLGVVGIVYGALVAMVQTDIKKLVAYSSVSHMGYVMVGLFAMNLYGMTGGLYQMLNHGISTGALFLLVGMIYERTHTREIKKYSGLAAAAPIFAIFFLIITFSSIAVPLTNGFVGEFLILLGAFMKSKWVASVAVLGVVLGASYMLWLVKRVFFGPQNDFINSFKGTLDLNKREVGLLIPLVIMVFWMGIYPSFFTKRMDVSLKYLLDNKYQYNLSEQLDRNENSFKLVEAKLKKVEDHQ